MCVHCVWLPAAITPPNSPAPPEPTITTSLVSSHWVTLQKREKSGRAEERTGRERERERGGEGEIRGGERRIAKRKQRGLEGER